MSSEPGTSYTSKIRPYLAKVALVDFSGLCSADMYPIETKLYANFLRHWMLTPNFTAAASRNQTRNLLPKINVRELATLPVPIPPRDDQERIAQLLENADAVRTKRREAVDLLAELAQSTFKHLFGDTVQNDREWPDSRTLGEVASIRSGITMGRKIPPEPVRAVSYVAVANVQERRLDLTTVKEVEASQSEIDHYRLKKNDLLLTEGGDPDKLGRGTLWQEEIADCIHQNHIFRVRLHDDSDIEPIFLNWLVASERGRQYFLRSAKQTTGIASINASQLKALPLLVPPIELQRLFGQRLAEIERQKAIHLAHLAELDALWASLQHRAFRGELFDSPAA